jgi:hypothetical protein
MGTPIRIERTSHLAAPPGPVWNHATSMAGVNLELAPWVRMTHPAWAQDISSAPELLGRTAFHSWLLAGGILPFDRHALRLLELDDHGVRGGRFAESSSSWLQARWDHEREVAPEGSGTRVTDRLVVEPRLAVARPVTAAMVGWLFTRRHVRLRSRFGVADRPVQSAPDAPSGARPTPGQGDGDE